MKTKADLTTYPAFTVAHSKRYKPAVLNTYLSETCEEIGCTKIHSDLYLLLRQQHLHRTIGVETLRNYVESMQRPSQTNLPTLTDDELFQMIEPKAINNITDAYQYSRYLQSHHDEIKNKYEDLISKRKNINSLVKQKLSWQGHQTSGTTQLEI